MWGEYFRGLVDEVRLYNRALSAAEIGLDITNGGVIQPVSIRPGNVAYSFILAHDESGSGASSEPKYFCVLEAVSKEPWLAQREDKRRA